MAKIVWLASYPKSGNTWMRALLTNYRRNGDEPVDINKLDGFAAAARVWFDEWVGVKASELRPDVVERLRPEVYRRLARNADDTLVLKVHDAWRLTPAGDPLFPSDVTSRVIYMVRDPRAVAVSYASHEGTALATAVEDLCDRAHTMATSTRGIWEQFAQPTRDWSGHVASWLDESGLNPYVVRFEELCADPFGVFAEVVRFIGLPLEAGRLAKAVRHSEFVEMQRQEQGRGFHERPASATYAFFRRGAPCAWRDELGCDLKARVVNAHGPMMRRLGYDEL